MRAAETVVQVQRDVHEPCGARHWGRAIQAPPRRAHPPRGSPPPRPPPALGPRLTAARGHPVQAQGQGDTAVGVGAGVVACIDQHRGAPGVGRASWLVGAGQDAHGVVAVQHHSPLRHLGPELLSVCRVCAVVTTQRWPPLCPPRAWLSVCSPPQGVPSQEAWLLSTRQDAPTRSPPRAHTLRA